jgi:hypothetical protein
MESADNNMATKIDEATAVAPVYFVSHRTQFNNQQGSSFSLMLLLVYSARGARSVKKTLPAESERDFLFRLLAVNFCNTCQLMFAPISTPSAFTGWLLSARESRDTPNKYTGTSNDNSLAAQGSLTLSLCRLTSKPGYGLPLRIFVFGAHPLIGKAAVARVGRTIATIQQFCFCLT